MSRGTRIFIGIFVVYLAGVAALLYRLAADIDPRYRESAEESLVDMANLLATLLERRTYDGIIPTDELERTLKHLAERPVYAKIFGIEKTAVNLHVYVTDRNGIVLFDSAGRDLGADYLHWRDVWLTLQGRYGARTSLADPADPSSVTMYVGAAIRERAPDSPPNARAEIVGMVAVGKPVAAFSPFVANARARLFAFGAVAALSFAVVVVALAFWLVRPFGLLRDLWRAMRAESAGPLQFGRRLLAAVRAAFAEARDTLVGRSYVEQYVQTLAHELKSPLAAIRGAAELLREPLPEETRAHFARNIVEQVARAQDLIDRLLELSALERRGALERVEPVEVARLADAVREEVLAQAAAKGLAIVVALEPDLVVSGDPFLLQRALANFVRNAIDFAPRGSQIEIRARAAKGKVEIAVRDRGPGLPAYAGGRVFERFYSLPRPDTGKKGTGLGLAFVREVAQLHGGSARLDNHPDGGAVATLTLPRAAR
ncbi:MAG TPA: two-component system sensor histidine kinase CreC [Burkholderiaceae bacterium]|jgi:two-component system sensor histidine kinase CreC|nr:two-component system sensor histidine kinase CreC [Burkholderiaceae bacterium]